MEPAREGADHADGGDGEHRDAPNKAAGDGEHAELDHPVAGALGRVFLVLFGLEAGVAPPDPVCREGAQGPEDRRRRRHHHHRLISGRDGRDEGERRRHEEGDGHPEEGASPLLDVVLAPIAPPRHDGAEGGEDVLHCVHELADRALLVVPVLLRGLGVVGRRGRTPTGAARGGRRLGVGVGVAHVRALRGGLVTGSEVPRSFLGRAELRVEVTPRLLRLLGEIVESGLDVLRGGLLALRLVFRRHVFQGAEVGLDEDHGSSERPGGDIPALRAVLPLLNRHICHKSDEELEGVRRSLIHRKDERVERAQERRRILLLEEGQEVTRQLRQNRVNKRVVQSVLPIPLARLSLPLLALLLPQEERQDRGEV